MLKRAIGIGLAAILGLCSLSVYKSETRVERAALRTSNAAREIEILEGGGAFFPGTRACTASWAGRISSWELDAFRTRPRATRISGRPTGTISAP